VGAVVVFGGVWALVTWRSSPPSRQAAVVWGITVGALVGMVDIWLAVVTLLASLTMGVLPRLVRRRELGVSGRVFLLAVAVGAVWVAVRTGEGLPSLIEGAAAR
jgi:hypothetical protein